MLYGVETCGSKVRQNFAFTDRRLYREKPAVRQLWTQNYPPPLAMQNRIRVGSLSVINVQQDSSNQQSAIQRTRIPDPPYAT